MFTFLKSTHGRLWRWFEARAEGPHARFWLSLLSFTESSFFLVPPDVLLMAMAYARPARWLFFALITTVASIAGAAFGYLLGAFFFQLLAEPIINVYGLHEQFVYVGDLFDRYNAWIMFIAAFTPIPFKVFVLGGGFFSVSFVPFLLASAIGRALRFYLVAWLAARFGPPFVRLCLRHAERLTIGAVGLLVLALLLWVVASM